MEQHFFALAPQFRERVWGGQRLHAANPPIGEAWVAFGLSVVTAGPEKGRTLDELARHAGPDLLGTTVAARFGSRFPILIKLLDCADWLSVQVHPDDAQARAMVGPDEFGKTEGWYFIETSPGSRILAGVKPGVGSDDLKAAIREGRVLEILAEVPVHAGEAIVIPAGTLHSLGPGLFLYEAQQASDTTYRAYDWGRPQSDGRKIHIEESVAVARPVGPEERTHPQPGAAGAAPAIVSAYFEVELARASGTDPLIGETRGLTFHILTVIEGAAEVNCGGETARLDRFETGVVAAATGNYQVRPIGGSVTLLRASVPGS
ncbi:MAG: type I phosphomannose isomerase catalytic subunit [Candidatus Limnocylindrales bacterium]